MNRFESNIERVRNFVVMYEERLGARKKSGRSKTKDTDLLRGAVVFLHATFEDLARTVLELTWGSEPASMANALRFPQPGGGSKEKETVAGLVRHRKKTVQTVLQESFEYYLDRASFNNKGEVKSMLDRCGLDSTEFGPILDHLHALAQRRHSIVHRADRNPQGGKGSYKASSINKTRVREWITAVEEFYTTLRKLLGPKSEELEGLLGER